MRWWVVLIGAVLLGLMGCGRVQRGEETTVAPPAPSRAIVAVEKELPPTEVPAEPKPVESAEPKPVESREPVPQTKVVEPSPPLTKAEPSMAASPETERPVKAKEEAPAPTPVAEAIPMSFGDEARSVRATADTLQSQFDRLPVGEVRARLLLLNQAVSELEVRSPALVLWRTALRLEVLSKAPYPDIAAARGWLNRARSLLAEQKVGLTTLEKAETALKANDWKGAVVALRDAANRLNAAEQAEALTQTRLALLNAIEALERQKPAVAKAEVGEAVKALDRLIATLP